MERIKVGKDSLPIYQEQIDGQTVYFILSREGNDGGLVTMALVEDAEGVTREHRSWRGVGVEATPEEKAQALADAKARFEAMSLNEQTIRKRLAEKRAVLDAPDNEVKTLQEQLKVIEAS